jgi:hypothetical protein
MNIFAPELLMLAECPYAWMGRWDSMDVMTVYANNGRALAFIMN